MPKEKLTLAQTELLFGRGKNGLDDSRAEQRDAKINIFTMSDALERVRLAIGANPYNWRLVPDPDGWNCGHSLYRKKSINFAGLESGYQTWRKIERSEDFQTEYNHFKNDLDKCIRELIKEVTDDTDLSDEDVKQQVGTYIKILTTFKDKVGQSGGQNLVTMATAGLWGMHQPSRSVSGHKDAYQAVPPLSAFSESLRSLTYADLLTVYPEECLKLLMICLGRTIVGEKGRKLKEGVIQSKPRIVVLSTGAPNLGKSTFTDALAAMMEVCGYTFGTIDPNAGKFGWGTVVTHGGIADDLDQHTPAKIVNLPIVKMISGSARNIWCENKGTPGLPLQGKGVIWINANEVDTKIHESDSGVLDRVCLITLLTPEEMEAKYGENWEQYRLLDHWANTSKKYKVSPEAIMLYLMRLAIDNYLELTGHIFTDERKVYFNYHREEDRLEKVMRELKAKSPAKLGAYHMKELVEKVGNLVALSIASVTNPKEADRYIDYARKSDFDQKILRKYIEIITSKDLLEKVGHLFNPEALDNKSFKHLAAKYKNGDFSDASWSKKDLLAQFSEILAGIYAQGQSYFPGKGIWALQEYEKQWKLWKRSLDQKVQEFRDNFQQIEDTILSTGKSQENIEYHREIWGVVRKELIVDRG